MSNAIRFTLNLARNATLVGSVFLTVCALAQQSEPGVSVSIPVRLEPNRGKALPSIQQQDITVHEDKEIRQITSFRSLAAADSDLLLLIDDSATGSFDTEIPTLKNFVAQLPPRYSVAVAYMRNGTAQFTQSFTKDHASAAGKIRLAAGAGGADVSPYDSLTDSIKKWPQSHAEVKQVIMIGGGIEGLGGGLTPDNPYVNSAIDSAIKAGVVVYAIYSPTNGHAGHGFWRNGWGQNFLSQLADETGGESYYIGFGSPVSFQPFLDQFMDAQKYQYLLTFMAKPRNKAGLQPIRV
jgi:hypothetical protein